MQRISRLRCAARAGLPAVARGTRPGPRGRATWGLAAALAAVAGEAAASEGGLELMPDPILLVLLIALFGVLVLPVNRLLFQPIFRVLDEREARIEGTRRRAEKLGAEADAVLGRYKRSIAEVREDAERERRALLEEARSARAARTAEARAAAEAEMARARDEVGRALAEAHGALRAQAEELARQIASRVLGRELAS